MPRKRRHAVRYIYVIRLKRSVLEDKRFCGRNPGCDRAKTSLYVGVTAMPPEERLAQHLSGYRSSRWVRKYGKSLFVEKTRRTYKGSRRAEELERQIAGELRAKGHAVWQA